MEEAIIISCIWTPLGIEVTVAIHCQLCCIHGSYMTLEGNDQEFVRPVSTGLTRFERLYFWRHMPSLLALTRWTSELFCCHCLILQNAAMFLTVALTGWQVLQHHPSWHVLPVRCFNGGLRDFRKRVKTSRITTLQPYLHPAEKASKWFPVHCLSLSGGRASAVAIAGTFPWGC